MKKTSSAAFSIAVFLVVAGCSELASLLPLNNNKPSYIKRITAYKEGSDGLMIYFVLADADGAHTTGNGSLELTISETWSSYSEESGSIKKEQVGLYYTHIGIYRDKFTRAKIGLGAFQHDAVLYPIGRIPYSSFLRPPDQVSGEIKIKFKDQSGATLSGQETVIF